MEYNSSRELLVIPEYGRNVQNLIAHAKTIEDKNERQEFIHEIIRLMMQMNPQNKNMDDFKERVWNHLFLIANYDIDVDPPEDINASKEFKRKIPDQVPYPKGEKRFRHYGHNIQVLIEKAIAMEAGPKQDEFVHVIGSYMKLAYRTWNREHFVSDEIILGDLESLSGGKLKLREDMQLDNLVQPSRKRPSNKRGSHKSNHKGNKGHKGHRNNKGGKRK